MSKQLPEAPVNVRLENIADPPALVVDDPPDNAGHVVPAGASGGTVAVSVTAVPSAGAGTKATVTEKTVPGVVALGPTSALVGADVIFNVLGSKVAVMEWGAVTLLNV